MARSRWPPPCQAVTLSATLVDLAVIALQRCQGDRPGCIGGQTGGVSYGYTKLGRGVEGASWSGTIFGYSGLGTAASAMHACEICACERGMPVKDVCL